MNRPKMNPILKKELTLGARTVRFPVSIIIYAGIMALSALAVLVSQTIIYKMDGIASYSYVNYASLSEGFQALAYIQLAMICVILPILTAGSIAGERERQTLDIMLVAPISPFSIVMGKLMASLSNVFVFIISSLPAMSLCFLYGGIQWQYLMVFIGSALVMAFFAGAIGVWASSVFKKTVSSVIITMIIEGVFYLFPLIVVAVAATVKYSIVVSQTTNVFNGEISLGWLPIILLLNPMVGFVDGMFLSNSGEHVMSTILNLFSGTIKTPAGFDFFADHWCWFSYAVTILLGMFFVWMATRQIDSIRRKGVNMKKKKA